MNLMFSVAASIASTVSSLSSYQRPLGILPSIDGQLRIASRTPENPMDFIKLVMFV